MVWLWLMRGFLSSLRSEPLIFAMSSVHHGPLALWVVAACKRSVWLPGPRAVRRRRGHWAPHVNL
eukprot:3444465-Alexandrium_andersonii.AAC.1